MAYFYDNELLKTGSRFRSLRQAAFGEKTDAGDTGEG